MRLKHHPLIRRFRLTGTGVMTAALLTLAFGAGLANAEGAKEYYVDAGENVCVGNTLNLGLDPSHCDWELGEDSGGKQLTFFPFRNKFNTALGYQAMFDAPFNPDVSENVAIGDHALFSAGPL